MKKQNILIRCDASETIGLGHVTRCLVLANEFRNHGHKVYFAMKNFILGITKVENENFDILLANEKNFDYYDWLMELVRNKKINIFIGDVRDGLSEYMIDAIKSKGILTVAIDEPSDYRKACDLCFYPPVSHVDDLNWDSFRGKLYKGWEYILLREEFYKNYKKVKNDIPNILIMMGGTDSYNLTLPILKQLLSLKQYINISVILDKNHNDYKNISKITNIKLYSNIEIMTQFLTNIDFGIISFGMSAYELLAMRIPAIHICMNQDHWSSSEVFEKENFAKRYKKEDIENIKYIDLKNAIISPIKQNLIYEGIICK